MAPSTLIRSLAELCGERLRQPKWLLAPSLRVGYQWLDAVARAGQPVLNVRLQTPRQLALELAAPQMERRGLTFLRGLERELLVARIFTNLRAMGPGKGQAGRGGAGYLTGLELTQSLVRLLARTLDELRLAGVRGAELALSARRWAEVPAKARELGRVLSGYERALARHGLCDYPDVLGLAAERVRGDLFALPADVLLLAPADLELAPRELGLWRAISSSQRRRLAVDQPVIVRSAAEPSAAEPQDRPEPGALSSDLGLLGWLGQPEQAPPPVGDGAVELMRAAGEVNEVRQVLRICVEREIPLDQVELLHTDAETYVPLTHELVCRLAPPGEPVPVTFSDGLPVQRSRPARALLGWLEWCAEGFPQHVLCRLVQDGLVHVPGHQLGPVVLARRLRALPIGAGRGRYQPALARALRRLERAEAPDEPAMEAMAALGHTVQQLLEQVPTTGGRQGQLQWLRAALQLLEHHAGCVSHEDREARQRLHKAVQQQLEAAEQWGLPAGLEMRDWLAELVQQSWAGGQGPRAGCLYVASLASGGHSGRPWTFIVGLDDGRFPGTQGPDPLLLDQERRSVSPDLPTSSTRQMRTRRALGLLLCRLRGRLGLSYSSLGLQDERDQFPAGLLLAIQRLVSGEPDLDLQQLLQRLPPPEGVAPRSAERCLDRADWWLWRLCNHSALKEPEHAVGRHFAHLARGYNARAQRMAPRITAYDGLVPAAGAALDPGRPDGLVLSATALETLARCPQEFFFRHVLRVEPVEPERPDPDRWLDPATRGALLHELFYQLIRRLAARQLRPSLERDWPWLRQLLSRRLTALARQQPPPTPEVREAEQEQLERSAQVFLREEEQLCRTSLPSYLEVAVGTRPAGRGTPLDSAEPLVLTLPAGEQVRVRGRLDRIDRLDGEAPRYAIWDYKTGSSRRYRENDPCHEGRHVQGVLYLALAQQQLVQRVSPGARVERFGYFFPTPWELGRRISWSAAELTPGLAVVQQLCRLLAAGCFVASDDERDQQHSPYRAAMGPLQLALASQVRLKLEQDAGDAAAPLRRLRGYEA